MSVTIEDVNDNLPKFDQDEYTVSILENLLQDQFVLQTKITDLDLVLFLKPHSLFVQINHKEVTLYFKDQFLLACILLAYQLFISTYKAHINALFCMTRF